MVQEFLDGELEEPACAAVRAHFDVCHRCYPHLKFELSFREAVRRVARGESAPTALRERVTQLLEDAERRGESGA